MKFCSQCGNQLNDTAQFCSKCGNQVATAHNGQQLQTRSVQAEPASPTPRPINNIGTKPSSQKPVQKRSVPLLAIVGGSIIAALLLVGGGWWFYTSQSTVSLEKVAAVVGNYDRVYNFHEGLARVEKENKYGYIDKNGKEVVPCIYNFGGDFSEGFANVKKDEKWGFIDKSGKEAIPRIFDSTSNFFEGVAPVKKNAAWGLINKDGKEVTPFVYDLIQEFDSEGFARAMKNGKICIIDTKGQEPFPVNDYEEIGYFYEGLAPVKKNDKWGFIDKQGKEIIPCVYEHRNYFNVPPYFSEGLAAVTKGEKNYYIDKTGREVFPVAEGVTFGFSDGLASVDASKGVIFYDKAGHEVFSCDYNFQRLGIDFSEGLAPVTYEYYGSGQKYGFIDKQGKEVIPRIYDSAYGFHEGLAHVRKNGKDGVIDKNGKEVIPCIYDFIDSFSEGVAAAQKDGKWGYIDKAGKSTFDIISAPTEANAHSEESIKKRVEEIFAKAYNGEGSSGLLSAEFSQALKFEEENAHADYFCMGYGLWDQAQDCGNPYITVKSVSKLSEQTASAEILIHCYNDDGRPFTIMLVLEDGEWKVDDFIDNEYGSSTKESLLECLREFFDYQPTRK